MKRTLGVTLLCVLLAATLLSGCSKKALGSSDRLAVVDGHPITKADLNTRLKILELFFRQPMDNGSTRTQLLDQLIRERLMREQADKMSITVSDAQVENEMAKFYGSLDKQYQTRDQVNQEFQKAGLTNDDLAAFMKDYLIGQAVMAKKQAEVTVTDDEVRAFYDQKKDTLYTFKEPVVHAAHILVPLDQEAKAKEVVAKAKAGGNFAELARLYSVDPGSARVGGDLGYFTRGSMVKELSDAAFSMKPGEIAGPVRSQFGYHIILLIDQQGPGVLSFDKARPDVVNRLLPAKQDKATQQWESDLERAAHIERTDTAGKNE